MNAPKLGETLVVFFPKPQQIILSRQVQHAMDSIGESSEPNRVAVAYCFTQESITILKVAGFEVLCESTSLWTDAQYKGLTKAAPYPDAGYPPPYPPYPCPCCGFEAFAGPPGSFEICKICGWEDDPVQLLDPIYRGGANEPSLIEAQDNFAKYGASQFNMVGHVRKPVWGESKAPRWRPATSNDAQNAQTPASISEAEETDIKVWYYWERNRFE